MIVLTIILVLGSGIGGCMYGYPQYNLYSQEMAGKAVLAEAESSRKVKTLEAKAAEESAKAYANAEVTRARGAAEANKILQNSLGGPEGYLRYLQIQSLDNTKAALIYVPTEAGLPMTEAQRLKKSQPATE